MQTEEAARELSLWKPETTSVEGTWERKLLNDLTQWFHVDAK